MVNIFDIKLLKTDTTLDLGQKIEKDILCSGALGQHAGAEPTWVEGGKNSIGAPTSPPTKLRRKKERRGGGRRKKKR